MMHALLTIRQQIDELSPENIIRVIMGGNLIIGFHHFKGDTICSGNAG